MKTYRFPGLRDVQAHTKSEARSLFKQQLREAEALTFRPQKITRLPAKVRVELLPKEQP